MLNKQSGTKCACTEEKPRTTKTYLDTSLGVATYVLVEGLERALAVLAGDLYLVPGTDMMAYNHP